MNLETCSICTKPMRGTGHQVCRKCVKRLGWREIAFGWFPERLADRNAHRRTGAQQ